MFVEDVYAQLRRLCDESDVTYFSEADAVVQMRQAYEGEFRAEIHQAIPYAFAERATFPMVNVLEYDFASPVNPTRLLGNPAGGLTGPRLKKILAILILNTDGTVQRQFFPVQGQMQLANEGASGKPVYFFANRSLLFYRVQNATFAVEYLPFGSRPDNATGVDWALVTVGSNAFIDDWSDFHDLIALMAWKNYASFAQEANPNAFALYESRLKEFRLRLSGARDNDLLVNMSYTPFGS